VPKYLFKPFYDFNSKINPQPAYLYVKAHAKRKDIVLQTTLEYGFFFLGDEFNHHYLRQQKIFDTNGNIKHVPYPKKNDPYYGRPIIDNLESLKKLMADSHSKIWLILGIKSRWDVGSEIKEFIRDHFQLKFSQSDLYDNKIQVYIKEEG
jgi:hypothetical protein